MLRRRRRRRYGRVVPAIIAVLIGLSVAGVIYWGQNPNAELKLPQGVTNRIAQQAPGERVPESFAAITATATPRPTNPLASTTRSSSDGGLQHQVSRIQLGAGESTEDRQADARAEAADSVAELERQVHAGINAERAQNGGSPLRWEARLAAVARAHSDDMTGRGYFSHDTPEGLGPSERIDRAGYSCWKGSHYGVAENIAIETTSGGLDRVAAEAVRSWMNSPGHRTNLLGRQYDRTGVGVSFGRWRGYDAVYLTQVFC